MPFAEVDLRSTHHELSTSYSIPQGRKPGRIGKKKRLGLYREKEQRAWLQRKAEQGGFRLLSVRASDDPDVGGWARGDDRRHKLKLFAVRFDGLLQIVDPQRLQETIRHGIGSGKGLGFGLLSLARPPA